MAYAVEEFDDDRAVARLAWLAQDDQAALDQACDVCLSYTDIDLGIRGRAIGLLARVLYPDLPLTLRPATADTTVSCPIAMVELGCPGRSACQTGVGRRGCH